MFGGWEPLCVLSLSSLTLRSVFVIRPVCSRLPVAQVKCGELFRHKVTQFRLSPNLYRSPCDSHGTTARGSRWGREGMRQSESSTFCNSQFQLAFKITGQFVRLPGWKEDLARVAQHPSCCYKWGSDATQRGLVPSFCKLSVHSPRLPSPLGRFCVAVAQRWRGLSGFFSFLQLYFSFLLFNA